MTFEILDSSLVREYKKKALLSPLSNVLINSDDRIEYVAIAPEKLKNELDNLLNDTKILQESKLDDLEIFYYASYIHLV